MAKSTTVSLVLIILVMAILNGTAEAAQRSVLISREEAERMKEFCEKEYKFSNCFKDVSLCYKCFVVNAYFHIPDLRPPPPRTHKIL
jgi:hypothetical protein